MTHLNCNLIDLSLEDDIPCSNTIQIKTENATQPSEATNEGPLFISPTWRKRDSLDNNPFDCVHKLAHRIDDPFDIVEKEVFLKAQQALKPPPPEVKLGNLLSLSDDNLLEEEQMPDTPNLAAEKFNKFYSQELDQESPPVMFNEKLLPDSVSGADTDSNPNSSAETTASAKLKKNMKYRKRLLKLSISNAAFSSPMGRKSSLEFEDSMGTPVSSTLSRAAEFGEHLLSAESPLKLVDEDDDLLTQEQHDFIDSEKIFEADLEMLKIPILNELPSPAVEQTSINMTPNSPNVVNSATSFENALPKLEAIKAKLKAKREEVNNNHQLEISSLIDSLKSLISGGETDKCKKQQAGELLESLSSALKSADPDETLKHTDMLSVAPQPIKRQGTFDIELQDNEEAELNSQPLVQEMPNCMVSSSATYDGETADEKQDLNLPEIAPLSPPTSPSHYQHSNNNNTENHLQPDVNDIMEQLSKLLINNSAGNQSNNPSNPTFIVVMNTNQLNHSNINNSHQNFVDAKQRSALVASYLENSLNDGSPDLTKVNPMARRRSQSLSIHDKVKIVQLPLQPPTPRSIQLQQRVQMDDSPPVTTTPPSGDKETPEFKTPARRIRCNSYSSGTPYTAQVGVRRTGFGSDNKNPPNMRRTQTLDTHHEGQQQAIVRPMSMPSNNLPTFKPDLKKKPKHNTESIIKSGPLKATIPVKKVAPMLKTSPPTPDNNTRTSKHHNTSLQSQSKLSRVPTTPLPAKGSCNLGVGYPNACSTPAGFTSPLKRTTGPVNKPRYSYMSATPNPKSSSSNAASSTGLKRRTLTEFKAKSPLKPRVSSVGLAAAAAAVSSSSRTSSGSTRLSTSAGARISKTPVKATTSNTATVKPTSRLSTRTSVGGSALSTRNKENKRP
ncbi:M-phase inducer phosphatase [Calliphora vicina]|uniref:M-phase inducer phosphatase n=1 Tax=Calliphora vicina TaxID=7373 RepID=UPI00325B6F1D